MKTFKQFILEDEADYSKVIEMLKRDCEPFLKEAKGMFMVRGVNGLNIDNRHEEGNVQFFKKTVRKDRHPLNSSKADQEMIDEFFGSEFRWYPRATAVFAVGESGTVVANSYGSPCYIFPIGPIEYLWSAKVTDLYGDVADIKSRHDGDHQEAVYDFLERASYSDMNLYDALHGFNEIMVKCDEYYAFPIKAGGPDVAAHRRKELAKAFT